MACLGGVFGAGVEVPGARRLGRLGLPSSVGYDDAEIEAMVAAKVLHAEKAES